MLIFGKISQYELLVIVHFMIYELIRKRMNVLFGLMFITEILESVFVNL